jgi:drug/metabolite transporter (DMT)-like permease
MQGGGSRNLLLANHSVRRQRPRRKEITVNKTLGMILIALGIVGLAWGGFTYTTKEKIVDIGPIEASRDKEHNVPVPPIAGAVALIGGVVLLAAGKKG